jgi:endonuclease/exonuclease/phosphatase family metal-dependent hydrolase
MMLSTRDEFNSSAPYYAARAGEVLTYPTKQSLVLVGKIVRPLEPGVTDQWATHAGEIAHRVLLVFPVLLSMPYNLTIGLIGFGLHAITTPFRKNVTLVKGNALYHAPNEIKLCSFNTALLPDSVNEIKGQATGGHCYSFIPGSLEERVDNIAREIIRVDADIVCLQEVFDPRAARLLKERLSAIYPNLAYNVNPKVFYFNSGLMTLSKYSIHKAKFHEFEAKTGIDTVSGKGFLYVKISLENGQQIVIYNTHMNSDIGALGEWRDDVDATRDQQLDRMMGHARKHPEHILCGDFNMWMDCEGLDYNHFGYILDHILAKSSLTEGKKDPMNNSSDHEAVLATINF